MRNDSSSPAQFAAHPRVPHLLEILPDTEIPESWGHNIEDARFAEINGETTGRHQHVIHKSGTRTRTSHDEYRHPASSGNAPGHSTLHSSARAGAIIGVRRPASGRREAQAVLFPGWVRMQEDRK